MPRTALGIDPARAVSDALDRFFEHYYRRRPVNATFTGAHDHDALLPDWSRHGLSAQRDEMVALHAELSAAHPAPSTEALYGSDTPLLDAELARAFLEIQLAEDACLHGVRGNPALWSGEAVFSVISLMIRDFAPLGERIDAATDRLEALPAFLAEAAETTRACAIPESWIARALRDCEGAALLLSMTCRLRSIFCRSRTQAVLSLTRCSNRKPQSALNCDRKAPSGPSSTFKANAGP